MSAEVLREAAALMRRRAEALSWDDGWYTPREMEDAISRSEGFVSPLQASDAAHIASWHPAVALAVADWLEAVAALHWPKRHDRQSEAHYNAEPEHDYLDGDCDEACWTEAYICNGCGTRECKTEISGRAVAVARAYLGERS